MRTLSANMQTAVALETTYLVTCWQITRTDGVNFFFTSHVEDLIIDGVTYLAATGMSASAIASGSDMSVDNLEVTGALTSDSITDADLISGKWDYASIQIFQVDYTALANGRIILRTGTIGAVSSGRNYYKAELRGMMQPFAEYFGRNVTPSCDTDLGSARCTVNLAPLTAAIRATTYINQISVTMVGLSALGHPSGYFTGGLMTCLTGTNAGLSREIKSDNVTTNIVTFQEAWPYLITANIFTGDIFSVAPGCDKTIATCLAKFNNVINFQGFPNLPGIDSMLKNARN